VKAYEENVIHGLSVFTCPIKSHIGLNIEISIVGKKGIEDLNFFFSCNKQIKGREAATISRSKILETFS